MKISYSSTSVAESHILFCASLFACAHESLKNQRIYNIFFVCRCVPFHMCLCSWPRYLYLLCCHSFVFYRHLQPDFQFLKFPFCRSSNIPSAPLFLVSLASCFNLLPLRYFIHCAPLYLPYKSRHSDFFFCFIFFSGDFLFICRTRS